MARRAVAGFVCMIALAGAAASPAAASPAAGGWTTTQLAGPPGELFLLGVSCPTSSFCAASGTQNLIATSTDPTGGPGAWHAVYVGEGRYEGGLEPVISGRQVQGISCPSSHLCVAVTTLGQIYSSTDPTGPASAWNVTELKPTGRNIHLYGVSCPTESFCVAVSGRRVNTGKVFTSTDPTGPASAWQEADLGESFDLRAVACASTTLCVAAGANGELVASRDPAGGAAAWSAVGAPGGTGILQSISCVPGACLTGNTGGNLLAAAEPTALGSWHETNGGGSVQITGSACATAGACLAVDANGDAIVSTDPTDASPGWTSTNVRPYSEAAERPGSEAANGLFGASCPGVEFCALVGSRGAILTSTEPFAAGTRPENPGGSTKSAKGGRKRGPKRPRTQIVHLRLRSTDGGDPLAGVPPRRVKLLVRFYADGPVRRFECRLDHRGWHRCRSPHRQGRIGRGIHRIQVRAVGRTGLRGRPAGKRFYVGRICRGSGHRLECVTGAGEMPAGWTLR
ncbi:MAG TPA: hypothetical protein VHB53_08995 [Solirubrobacterales bacterium]|nr:hypothetical protein [Solirubrobacterales bacterium]